MNKKEEFNLIAVSIFAIAVIHTILLFRRQTPHAYERLLDFCVIVIAVGLCVSNLAHMDKKNAVYYIITAGLLTVIFTVHLLSLIYGGLLC